VLVVRSITDSQRDPGFCFQPCGRLLVPRPAASNRRSRDCAWSPLHSSTRPPAGIRMRSRDRLAGDALVADSRADELTRRQLTLHMHMQGAESARLETQLRRAGAADVPSDRRHRHRQRPARRDDRSPGLRLRASHAVESDHSRHGSRRRRARQAGRRSAEAIVPYLPETDRWLDLDACPCARSRVRAPSAASFTGKPW